MATKTVTFEISARPTRCAGGVGTVRSGTAAGHECDQRADGDCGPIRDGRRQANDAGDLRLELPGRDLRLLLDAHQSASAHGLLGAGGKSRPAHQTRALSNSRWCATCRWTAPCSSKPEEGEGVISDRWKPTTWARDRASAAGAGGELPAFELHQLHLLNGGVPQFNESTGYVAQPHRAGKAIHNHRGKVLEGERLRALTATGHPGVRLRAQLRRSLPEKLAAGRSDLRHWAGRDCAEVKDILLK